MPVKRTHGPRTAGRTAEAPSSARSVAAILVGFLLAAPLAAVVVPLWAVAALTRALARLLERHAIDWTGAIRFDERLGWRLRPGMAGRCRSEPQGDLFRFVTDAEGWRGSGSVDRADIVVLGDSYAFGYGCDERRCFHRLVRGLTVKPVAAPGYDMVQGVLLLEQLAGRLADKLVVWLVYVGNDLRDNLRPHMRGYRAPFVREARNGRGWEIVTAHIRPDPYPRVEEREQQEHRDDLGHTYSDSPAGRRACSAAASLIGRAARACGRVDARLVVVTVPDPFELTGKGRAKLRAYAADPDTFDPELPHRRLGAACETAGVRHASLRDRLTAADYARDRHWTAKGHRTVATLLRELSDEATSIRASAEPSDQRDRVVASGGGGHGSGGRVAAVLRATAKRASAGWGSP